MKPCLSNERRNTYGLLTQNRSVTTTEKQPKYSLFISKNLPLKNISNSSTEHVVFAEKFELAKRQSIEFLSIEGTGFWSIKDS